MKHIIPSIVIVLLLALATLLIAQALPGAIILDSSHWNKCNEMYLELSIK